MHKHVAGTALVVVLLAGCGGSSSGATGGGSANLGGSSAPGNGGLAVVVGAHANSPIPQMPSAVNTLIQQAVAKESRIAILVNEGTPEMAVHGTVPLNGNNPQAKAASAQTITTALNAKFSQLAASTPQSDLLSSISLGAREISGATGQKTVAVVDSGLQTKGALEFQDAGMLESDPDDVAEYLKGTDNLPDLTGVKVILVGIGDTAPPQQELTQSQQNNLRAIWKSVLTSAGADVDVSLTPQTGSAATGLPDVTPVPTKTSVNYAPAVAPKQTVAVQLTQAVVAFKPSSSGFVNQSEADKVLKPLAQHIKDDGLTVHLVGSTATHGSLASQVSLSKERANAVKQRLVAFGVTATKVTTEGVGSRGKDHVPDVTSTGQLIPGPAARNRKVTAELSKV